MGAFVTSAENSFLDLLCRNQGWANIGDATGIRPSTADGSLYISGCSSYPGDAANQTTGEVSYAGYTRAAVARTTSAWNAPSNGSISPVNPISWGKKTDAGTVTIVYLIVGTASSGVGTALLWGAIGDPTFVSRPFNVASTTSDTLRIPTHGLAADDRIAFFPWEPDSANFPTDLTEGTVYFVRSAGLTTDEFTVATTSGGAAVNLTVLGNGYAIKIKPLVIAQNLEPRIAGSSLIVLS